MCSKPQSIDVALLWPGRFVLCDFPGWHECLEILEVHSREVSLASDASLEDVASLTERFTVLPGWFTIHQYAL